MAKHLCSIDDLAQSEIDEIFERAALHIERPRRNDGLTDQIVACLFFEPSTRTHLSFESAAKRLGLSTLGFADASTSSASKGETLEDTIRVVQNYADAIVLRHPEAGAATRAAAVSSVPVINAGDGDNEHPTQTLLDLFTVQQRLGTLKGIKIGFAGDVLYGRTAHSLAKALASEWNELVFVAPESLQPSDAFLTGIGKRGASVTQVNDLAQVITDLDVLYMTRPQRERWPKSAQGQQIEILSGSLLAQMKRNAIVMHPLPRTEELPFENDSDPRSVYFQQVSNGVPVRMAILEHLMIG